MIVFGWCSTGHHEQCVKKYQRFYIGLKKVKRKSVETIVWLDEWRECECVCHGGEPVKKTRKPTARRKK